MKKFVAIYYSPAADMAAMADITPEQKSQIMGLWMAWKDKVGETVVDFGAPLMPGHDSSDGKNWAASQKEVSGYSILQAESLDALKALCNDHPHLQTPGATIGLHEVMAM